MTTDYVIDRSLEIAKAIGRITNRDAWMDIEFTKLFETLLSKRLPSLELEADLIDWIDSVKKYPRKSNREKAETIENLFAHLNAEDEETLGKLLRKAHSLSLRRNTIVHSILISAENLTFYSVEKPHGISLKPNELSNLLTEYDALNQNLTKLRFKLLGAV